MKSISTELKNLNDKIDRRNLPMLFHMYHGLHCKKTLLIFPSPAGKPNSLWPGIIKLFPARESLDSDIPAGDRKIVR